MADVAEVAEVSGAIGETAERMTRRWVAFLVISSVVLVFALCAAAPASAASLTPDQEALASDLDGRLISPCCWTQTIAVHDSQIAEELRAQVRLLVAQGLTEDDILDALVAQYGEEILAAPRAAGFNLLAYALPALIIILGVVGIALLALRWRDGGAEVAPAAAAVGDRGVSAERDPLRSRLDEELSRFDS